jgi:hypothetical protein
MHEAGVVDVLAEDGAGEAAVRDYIHRSERRRNGMQAVFSCRQHVHPVGYEELLNIANVWVNAALRLEEKDLKLMSRLARSQSRRVPGGAAARPDAVEIRECSTRRLGAAVHVRPKHGRSRAGHNLPGSGRSVPTGALGRPGGARARQSSFRCLRLARRRNPAAPGAIE